MKRRTYLALAGSLSVVGAAGCLEEERKQWVFDAEMAINSSPTIVGKKIYIGTYNTFGSSDAVHVIDSETGNEEWQTSLNEEAHAILRAPYVDDETVFVTSGAGGGDEAGAVRALRKESGERKWIRRFEQSANTSSVVSDDKLIFAVGGRIVYALDADDGDTEWVFDTNEALDSPQPGTNRRPLDSSPTVVDGTVYVGSVNGALHAIDVETGTENWHFEIGSEITSSPTLSENSVYVGSEEGSLYALNANNGDEQWRRPVGESVVSSPTVADNTVICCGLLGTVHAFDAKTDESKWQFETAGQTPSSPTVAGQRVFIGDGTQGSDSTGHVYSIDLNTGQQEWKHDTGGQIVSSPTVVDGTVYVGSGGNSSSLYAIDAGVSGSSTDTRVNLRTLGYHDEA